MINRDYTFAHNSLITDTGVIPILVDCFYFIWEVLKSQPSPRVYVLPVRIYTGIYFMIMLPLTLLHTLLSCLVVAPTAVLCSDTALDTMPYAQQALDQFNLLKHQGGHGPYSSHPGFGISRDPPPQCTVDQVQLFFRHGERYPTVDLANSLSEFLHQVGPGNENGVVARNSLAFLNAYKSPALKDPGLYEQETFMGPYGGYQSMFSSGSEMRARYGHLWTRGSESDENDDMDAKTSKDDETIINNGNDNDNNDNTIVPFFTASQERIVVTAINVARGFFGSKWKKHAQFVVLNETSDSGLNSLTPELGCPAFNGRYKGDYTTRYGELGLADALARFLNDLELVGPDGAHEGSAAAVINATTEDIANLMSLCMYDLNAAGESSLCEYFTPNDWKAFEYKRDLDYYYYSGNGNPTVPAIGGVVSNATLRILEQPSSSSSTSANTSTNIYFNFAHETNLLMYLTSIGIFNPSHDLDWQAPSFRPNQWTTSHIVPMGARVALERLSYQNASDPLVTDQYVRFVVNDAVIPLDGCTTGPGFSCPLEKYLEIQGARIPSALETCGIETKTHNGGRDDDDEERRYKAPRELSFYWDWNSSPEKYPNHVVDLDDF